MERVLSTPETHPNHETIGQTFKDWVGNVFYCDSYEDNLGFWMTRADAPEENKNDQYGKWRRNVSERAIGRTFHRQY